MSDPFTWPDPDGPCDTLCSRCASLHLDTEPAYYSFPEEKIRSYGIRPFNWYREDQLILAQDRIINLSQTASCPLCQLITAAVREQYQLTKESVAPNHSYALLCRYVPLRFRRYEPNDTELIRYIEIVSQANCEISGSPASIKDFHHKDQTVSRDTARSILVPATLSQSAPKYMNAKVLEDKIDFNLLRGWLQKCEKLHGKNCKNVIRERADTLPSPSFMVIDVQEMRLTTPAPAARHIALSYCWGPKGKNSFLTTTSNVTRLRQPGGLNHVWRELPATIQDAISLAKKLGEKFLWIDSLCIIQDDPDSVKKNIDSMQMIYAEAALTIIAASGEDATAGLPGLRPGTRSQRQRVRSLGPRGHHYVLVDDLELAMTRCPWVKRGWTYQEWFLSSKCLIFINSIVVFTCYQDTWREDIAADIDRPNAMDDVKSDMPTSDPAKKRRSFLSRIFKNTRKRWANTVAEGSSTKASVQSHRGSNDPVGPKLQDTPLNDVDFSYVAIGYELRPGRRRGLVTNFQSEPTDVFMMTLREYLKRELRYPDDRLNAYHGIVDYYARVFDTVPVAGSLARFSDWAMVLNTYGERRPSFPSWSWSGWSGQPTWLMQNNVFEWMDYNCWIVWHYRGQESETITPIKRSISICFDANNPATSEALKVIDEEDWKDLDSLAATIEWFIFKKGWTREATPTRLPDGPLCTTAISTARGFLQFWTLALPVTFKSPLQTGKVKLFDSQGVECGDVMVDQEKIGHLIPVKYEIIVLSEADWMRGVKWSYIDKHQQDERARGLDDVVDGMLNVMLIGWIQGIAERMGIGTVWKEVITYSPKEEIAWREIVLA